MSKANYFLCEKRDIPRLIKKAETEAAQILKEFSDFYTGDIRITIEPQQHATGWSIKATLMVNGEPVKTEDPCDLLFLELNELMINRILQSKSPVSERRRR